MIDSVTYTTRIGLFRCIKIKYLKKNDKNCLFDSNIVKYIICSAALTNIAIWTIIALWLVFVEIYFAPERSEASYYNSHHREVGDSVEMKLRINQNESSYEEEAEVIKACGPGFMLTMLGNKFMKITNGNVSKRFLHWNGGSAYLENKLDKLESLIAEEQPLVLAVSEANWRQETDVISVNLENYTCLALKAIRNENIRMSRVVVYVRKDVKYKRRFDLENDVDAMLWLELSYKNGRKLLVGTIYREFKLARQPDNATASGEAQITRWSRIVDSWEAAGLEGDVMVMGDLNLDWNKWNDFTGLKAKLRDIVNDKLITIGFAQIIDTNTHRGVNEESIIDHIWINCPRRIICSDVIQNLDSDHEVITAQIRGRDLTMNEDKRMVRRWKNYSKERFVTELEKMDWSKLYVDEDINNIVNEFTKNIITVLDKIALVQNQNNSASTNHT